MRTNSRFITAGVARTYTRVRVASTAAAVKPETGHGGNGDLKSIADLDGPKGWPVFGDLFNFLGYAVKGKTHIYYHDKVKVHGELFKNVAGGQLQVIISNPDIVEDVLRKEMKTPVRPSNPSWDDFRKDNNESNGLLTSKGEEWQVNRSALNKQMLRPKNVNQYCEELNDIVGDMVKRLEMVAEKQNGGGVFIPALPNELYKWSLESICSVMFETRLGCLKREIDPKIQYFIDNINEMWYTTIILYVFYPIQRKFKTKAYKNHMKNWTVIFDVARENITRRRKELETAGAKDRDQAFLTRLLLNKDLSEKDLVANLSELLMAAVDTTSNTCCFMLYNLANNPTAQEKLYDEIKTVIGDGEPDTAKLEKMSYLKMCLKENYRLFPVAPINARILTTETNIGGYLVPENAMAVFNHYTPCRNSKYFHDPDTFIPERWSRTDGDDIHPFASVPFGHGSRSCIGRRFAELELKLALIQILKKYKVTPHKTMELDPFYRTILSPGKEVPVILEARS